MADNYKGEDRREFLRHRHEEPVQYRILDTEGKKTPSSKIVEAISKNLSASGILFTSKKMPRLSSLLLLDLDYRAASICREVEQNALIVNNRLFGKVVRVEETNSGYDIGVAFVKKFDDLADTIKELMA